MSVTCLYNRVGLRPDYSRIVVHHVLMYFVALPVILCGSIDSFARILLWSMLLLPVL